MSVPTNIVEGRAQKSEPEFRRFLGYAAASLDEVEYHLLIAHEIDAIGDSDFLSLTSQVQIIRKQTHSLINRLQAGSQQPKKP